ncbi:MAG: exopolysaccharide biosynthesis polyprenyl glycosylphosphotransferase [Actinobacteria bacterium]|nr:exopolysaccharide biosynthesis polyprenyl glycosylphosphotransferase [Actinomycetota bacterium]
MHDQWEGPLRSQLTRSGHAERSGRSRSSPPLGALVLLGDAAGMAIGLAAVRTSQVAVTWLLATLVIIVARGHHRLGLAPSLSRDAAGVAGAVIVPVVVLGGLQGSAQSGATLMRSALLATLAVLAIRGIVYAMVRGLRSRRVLTVPTVVIGAGPLGVEVARVLQDHPEYGSGPVGFLDDVDDEDDLPLPVLGPVSSLEAVVRSHGVRRVMVAFGPTTDAEMVGVVRACDRAAVEIHVLPRFFELGAETTEEVWGLPFVRVGRSLCHPGACGAKRAFDVVVASLSLLVAAPVMAVVAVLVRLSSPGPILFRQARVGQHGRPVEVLKFRSMEVNDEADTQWSVATDQRVTAVGSFLRRSSLDELPQLFNVLRGDMSLVGPRPERPFYVERFSEEVAGYRHRHRAPVGMTGWSQVNGLRGDTSIEERARLDNHYIENWSPWKDMVTLARTVSALFRSGRPGPAPQAPAKALAPAPAPCLPEPMGKPAA